MKGTSEEIGKQQTQRRERKIKGVLRNRLNAGLQADKGGGRGGGGAGGGGGVVGGAGRGVASAPILPKKIQTS